MLDLKGARLCPKFGHSLTHALLLLVRSAPDVVGLEVYVLLGVYQQQNESQNDELEEYFHCKTF